MSSKKKKEVNWPKQESHWNTWLLKKYESEDLDLRMVSRVYLQAQIDKLKTDPKFTKVLQLEQFTEEEIAANRAKAAQEHDTRGAAKKKPPESKKASEHMTVSDKILENKPAERDDQFKGGKQAAAVYGMASMDKLCRLQEYLEINGGFQLKYVPKDGTCLWQSILECTHYPGEFQYQMLKRQVILTATEHPDFFLNLIDDHIQAVYGSKKMAPVEYLAKQKAGKLKPAEIDDQESPGPFSFCSYLEYLLLSHTWGDYAILLMVSMMWQVKIMVVMAESLYQERIRHESKMKDANIVLVYCGANHYVPAVMFVQERWYDEPVEWKLHCKALEKVGAYDLTQEDPDVFRNLHPEYPREWKDVPLPKPGASEVVSSLPVPGPAEEVKKELLAIHHTYVEVLLSMGVDPLKHYQEKKAENVLGRVKSGDRRCQICNKGCSSTQKLKNHIRRRHIGKTPYFCGECQRYYGDSQSLKIHLKKHADPGTNVQTHSCNQCSRSYATLGKLNEHLQKHQDIQCQYCKKNFAYEHTKNAHEAESCPQKPKSKKATTSTGGASSNVPESGLRWYCHLCDSDYGARHNLKKHLNKHHDRAEVAPDARR